MARAFLEEVLSAQQAKDVAGRLGDKQSETYLLAAEEYRELRDTTLPSLFDNVTREQLGGKPPTLDGQELLGPEAASCGCTNVSTPPGPA